MRLPLFMLPDGLHAAAIARIVNRLLAAEAPQALAALEARTVCVRVSDTGNLWCFRIENARLQPSAESGCEAWIQGQALDFLRIALRLEDPDTLFFERRLCLSGDTELGLHAKNVLDGLSGGSRALLLALLGPRAARPLIEWSDRLGLDARLRSLARRVLEPPATAVRIESPSRPRRR